MNMMNQSNIGWVVENGSGWNHHKTADVLKEILISDPDALPAVPLGYGVLVAPISDKPFGLRCMLVKVQPRKTEIIDDAEYDDGPDDAAGEEDGWALDRFGMHVKKIYSVKAEHQSSDASRYFIKVMAEQIAKL
jgi:hypothetical protein